jgi:hypothetical protein
MSGFNASETGPQSLGENSVPSANSQRSLSSNASRPDSASRSQAKAKLKRAMRRGQISTEAAKRHLPTIVILIGRHGVPVTHSEDNADLQAAGDHSWGDRGL